MYLRVRVCKRMFMQDIPILPQTRCITLSRPLMTGVFHSPRLYCFLFTLQGGPSPRIVGLGWLWSMMFHHAPLPVLPIYHQPKQNQADGGTAKIIVNQTIRGDGPPCLAMDLLAFSFLISWLLLYISFITALNIVGGKQCLMSYSKSYDLFFAYVLDHFRPAERFCGLVIY